MSGHLLPMTERTCQIIAILPFAEMRIEVLVFWLDFQDTSMERAETYIVAV